MRGLQKAVRGKRDGSQRRYFDFANDLIVARRRCLRALSPSHGGTRRASIKSWRGPISCRHRDELLRIGFVIYRNQNDVDLLVAGAAHDAVSRTLSRHRRWARLRPMSSKLEGHQRHARLRQASRMVSARAGRVATNAPRSALRCIRSGCVRRSATSRRRLFFGAEREWRAAERAKPPILAPW